MSDIHPDASSDPAFETIRKKLDTNPREALHLSLDQVEDALEQENPRLQAEGRLNAGWAYHYLGQPSSAMTEFLRSLQIFKSLSDFEGVARTLHGLGTLHHRLGDVEISTEHYSQLLDLAQKHKLKPWEFTAYNRLGELNLDLGRSEQAEEFLKSAEALVRKKGTPAQLTLLKLNSCHLELTRGDFNAALLHLEETVAHLRNLGEHRHLSHALHLLGRCYAGLQRYQESQASYLEALQMMQTMENSSGRVKVLLELTRYHLSHGDPTEAESLCKEALDLSGSLGLRIEESQACKLYAEISENLGKTQQGLDFYKRYIRLYELLQNETITRRLANLKLKFQLQNAEKESLILQENNKKLEFQTKELSAANERISYINDVAQELVGTLDAKELSRRFSLILHTLLPLASIGFGIYNPPDRTLDFFHWETKGKIRSPSKISFIPSGNLPSQVLHQQKEIITSWDPSKPAVLSPNGIKEIWVFPLGVEENFSGIAVLESAEKDCFDGNANLFVRTLSRYYAASLQNSFKHHEILRLNEVILREKQEIEVAGAKAEYLAHHDSLTGAVNRLMLNALVKNAISQSSRRKEKFALVYIDLDGFKPINDTYGHAAGDEALKAIANAIQKVVRETDTLARVGGDEFVTLLNPVLSKTSAEQVASKIRKAIREPFNIHTDQLRLDASMGISVYPDDGTSLDELLGIADREMYEMKNKARLKRPTQAKNSR